MLDRSLPQIDELYKEIILEHYRNPYGRVPVKRTDYQAEGVNPLCGDEVKLGVELEGDKIKDVQVEAHGCSICVASSSMLANILQGKAITEAKKISTFLKDIMQGKVNGREIDIGDLEVLSGVKKFPLRIKCALLPWTTLDEAFVGHDHVEMS